MSRVLGQVGYKSVFFSILYNARLNANLLSFRTDQVKNYTNLWLSGCYNATGISL